LQGKLEADIAQLSPDEAALFLAEYNIEEPSLNRMIRLSYDLLGLQSFFTAGRTSAVPGRYTVVPPLPRQPARSTAICKKGLSAPRWWPMTT
jgi:ribosome-binding ATPase YchF (GTP1/OBG family)